MLDGRIDRKEQAFAAAGGRASRPRRHVAAPKLAPVRRSVKRPADDVVAVEEEENLSAVIASGFGHFAARGFTHRRAATCRRRSSTDRPRPHSSFPALSLLVKGSKRVQRELSSATNGARRKGFMGKKSVSLLLLMLALGCGTRGQPICDSASCPTGCCSSDGCQFGTEATACGSGGTQCSACLSGQSCIRSVCSETSRETDGGREAAVDGGGTPFDAGLRDAGQKAGDGGCAGTLIGCRGTCTDTASSADNCGACGASCNAGEVCSRGACGVLPTSCAVAGCPTSYGCDPTDLKCKPGCFRSQECPAGATCDAISHVCRCSAGTHACGQMCVSDDSQASCGTRCDACANSGASQVPVCTAGQCDFTCAESTHRCANECVPRSSIASCGLSCTPCTPPANAAATCDGTSCEFTCLAGFHRCGSSCASNTSTASCGSNCAACSSPVNAASTCDGVSCGFTCLSGSHLCGGACSPNTSANSCGTTSCTTCMPPANATATCDGVTCGFACNSGSHVCAGQCASNTDVETCGASCSPCSPPSHATATCNGTSCGFNCNAGYVHSGSKCIAACTTGSCGSGQYCAPNGLCQSGCETTSACDSLSVCNPTDHTCVTGVLTKNWGTNCPAGYGDTFHGCTYTHMCVYAGVDFSLAGYQQQTSSCPAQTTERGSYSCFVNSTFTWTLYYCAPP